MMPETLLGQPSRCAPSARLIKASALALTSIAPLVLSADPAVSPPFSIQQRDQVCWLVKPGGEQFFSLGVCCVNQGVPPKEWDPANPGYAAWKHYADSNA